MAENNIKKFLDSQGVTTLWGKIAANIQAEKDRAMAAEAANATAAKKAQEDVDALTAYVGTIPGDEAYAEITNIVAFIQKRAAEVLAAAQGGSSETAASVKAALDEYKALNDPLVTGAIADIAAIEADYLKQVDKTELAGLISTNADEIARIDAALKLAIDDEDGAGLNSIKDLATWIEEHGEEAAGYAAAISALEGLVGNKTVAAQIAEAIAAESLNQYAKTADIQPTLNKVDTQGTVTEAINAAITALSIGDYAKAADLTTLAARVTALENANHQNAEAVTASINAAIAALKAENLWDASGAAATAEANAKAYADSLATNYDESGAAAQALVDAKAYVDGKGYATTTQVDVKQDAISDLETIRSGAAAGATALQAVPAEYVTETELTGKGYLTANDLVFAEDADIDALFA